MEGLGKRPLWVAKQHGHSITTMLGVYAAWADGAVEPDIYAIKHAMASRPRTLERAITGQTREPEQFADGSATEDTNTWLGHRRRDSGSIWRWIWH